MNRVWRLFLPAAVLCLTPMIPAADAPDASAVIGNWEGESKCTVSDSPCHDEHVVYEIKADAQPASKLSLDAYKIVSGEKQFMGTLDCQYSAAEHTLRCIGRRPDDVWTFTVTDQSMSGTLTIGSEKKLYRKIRVGRISPR